MSSRQARMLFAVIALIAGTGTLSTVARGQNSDNEIVRRAKNRVQPEYPELARKMNITGTVKVQVVVAANGSVKDAKVLGGHPVLASAALDAVKKWRFEPASGDTTGVVDFKFEPHQ